jgi:hypothetical protein
VATDERKRTSTIQITDPAVVATLTGTHAVGTELAVRVVGADPIRRTVELSLAD